MWDLFICACRASIKTDTFAGKECYYISNFRPPLYDDYLSNGMYVDKETGLVVSTMAYETFDEYSIPPEYRMPATEYVYEFNTVTEEDFIQPDISEYEIVDSFYGESSETVGIGDLLRCGLVGYDELEEYIAEGLIPYELDEEGVKRFEYSEAYQILEKIRDLKEQGLSVDEIKSKLKIEN